MSVSQEQSYVSLEKANVYNQGNSKWSSATEDQKNDALFMGRVYLNQNFRVINGFNPKDAPLAIQKANAFLAKDFLSDRDEFFGKNETAGIRSEKSVADTVEYSVSYFSAQSKDRFPYITALVSGYLKPKGTYTMVTR